MSRIHVSFLAACLAVVVNTFFGPKVVSLVPAAYAGEPSAKPDYKKLLGKWLWEYELGHTTLTIMDITPSGSDAQVFAKYEVYTPSWGIDTYGRGDRMMGWARQNGSIELKFIGSNRGWSFEWNGDERLSGYGTLRGWEGYGDFYKKQ